MKLLVVLCLAGLALAKPQNFGNQGFYNPNQYKQPAYVHQHHVPILSQSQEVNPDGSFSYSYSTGDGQQSQAVGYLKNAGNPQLEAQTVQGSYSYTAPDGTPITVRYIADENGFRAEGAHLPTPPPIPEAIQKSLNLIAQAQRNNPNYQQYQETHNQQQYYNPNTYNNQYQYRPYNRQY